jgi:hypothetical protein
LCNSSLRMPTLQQAALIFLSLDSYLIVLSRFNRIKSL